MKKIILSVAAVASLSAFTILTNWKADEKASVVNWELKGSDKKGTFGNLVSTIDFDKSNLDKSKIAASVDVKTLKAGNEKLENHLLSPDFFDAEKFPKITFTSSEIRATESGYVAKGTLNMKDSAKVIGVSFNFTEESKTKGIFTATMTVNASDYGVTKANKKGSDEVLIFLNVPVSK